MQRLSLRKHFCHVELRLQVQERPTDRKDVVVLRKDICCVRGLRYFRLALTSQCLEDKHDRLLDIPILLAHAAAH